MFVYSFLLISYVLIVLSVFCYYNLFPLIDVRYRVALLEASETEGIPVSPPPARPPPRKKKGGGERKCETLFLVLVFYQSQSMFFFVLDVVAYLGWPVPRHTWALFCFQ